MAYFNWNVKVWEIFLFSLPTRGDIPTFGAEWGGLNPFGPPPPPRKPWYGTSNYLNIYMTRYLFTSISSFFHMLSFHSIKCYNNNVSTIIYMLGIIFADDVIYCASLSFLRGLVLKMDEDGPHGIVVHVHIMGFKNASQDLGCALYVGEAQYHLKQRSSTYICRRKVAAATVCFITNTKALQRELETGIDVKSRRVSIYENDACPWAETKATSYHPSQQDHSNDVRAISPPGHQYVIQTCRSITSVPKYNSLL